jgi:hypothetical protein
MARSYIAMAAVVAALAQAPAVTGNDLTQLIEAAGLTPAEARGMTLNEIQAYKYNRGRSSADSVTVSTRSGASFETGRSGQLVSSAGLGSAPVPLSEVAAHKINRGADSEGRIPVGVTSGPRFVAASNPQLVAGAGLKPAEASGMSLSQIQAQKWNRAHGGDERQDPAE